MAFEVKKLENSKAEVVLTIEGTEFKNLRNKVIAKIAQGVEVPGFRKGKVPASVVEEKYADAIKEEISEEIIQESFYNLWKNRQELKITKSIKSYLFNSIRNRSIDYCRKRKYEESPSENLEILGRISEEPSPVELMEAEELNSIIKTGLKKMPARRRDIFLMSRLGNKKHEEIASLLSLSVKTVEAEMGKALKLLKKETGYTR